VVYAGRHVRGPDAQVDRFLDALVAEIALRARPGARLGSVYLGGGTPSLMPPAQIERVLLAAEAFFGFESHPEITLEVNPGPDDRGDLEGFRAAGVTRVSIGAQSLQPDELRSLGRRHAPPDVAETVRQARASGFESVSIDLLYDVPGQTISGWRASLDGTLALEPDHVSAYALTLDDDVAGLADHLPPREGAMQWRARARTGQDEDRAADMYELADDMLARAGLSWYEISNWARPGHESRHNLAYWNGQPWEAVGPGAHRFDGTTRSWNNARIADYLAALDLGKLPPGESGPEINRGEALVLRLRTVGGVRTTDLPTELVAWARGNDLLETTGDVARLTRKGRLLGNEVAVRLLG
jgi:oxygen-independent coproporphyrinogen-3 oxidase